jgi:hypothetical protein
MEIKENLSILARREYFQFNKQERIRFFRIHDAACAKTFEITDNDTIAFIIKSTESKHPMISNDKIFTLEYLANWLNTALCDT